MSAQSDSVSQPRQLADRIAERLFSWTTNRQGENSQVPAGRSVKAGTDAMSQKAAGADATLRRYVCLGHKKVESRDKPGKLYPPANVQIVPEAIDEKAEDRGL